MDINGNLIYAVDFDGTLSLGVRWPECGQPNKPLFDFLIREKKRGRRIILWTCRAGDHLRAAIEFCEKEGLVFDTVNENLPELIEAYGNDCRKVNADYYIDDKAICLKWRCFKALGIETFWGRTWEENENIVEEGED